MSSFFALLRQKSLDKISVKEICDGARCSRNTFYVYYPHKEAVYEHMVNRCIDKMRTGFRTVVHDVDQVNDASMLVYAQNVLSVMLEVRDVVTVLLNNDNTNYFYRKFYEIVYELWVNEAKMLSPNLTMNTINELYFRFMAGGIANFFMYVYEHPEVGEADLLNPFYNMLFSLSSVVTKHL